MRIDDCVDLDGASGVEGTVCFPEGCDGFALDKHHDRLPLLDSFATQNRAWEKIDTTYIDNGPARYYCREQNGATPHKVVPLEDAPIKCQNAELDKEHAQDITKLGYEKGLKKALDEQGNTLFGVVEDVFAQAIFNHHRHGDPGFDGCQNLLWVS